MRSHDPIFVGRRARERAPSGLRALMVDPGNARGVTLIELMVTVGIIAVLVTLSGLALTGMKPAAERSTAARDFSNMVQAAQFRARNENFQIWIGVAVPAAPGDRIRLVTIDDPDWDFDPDAYDFLDPDNTIRHYDRVIMPASVSFVPENQFGNMDHVPVELRPEAGSIGDDGCSFCSGGAGWIRALPSGEVRYRTPGTTTGPEALIVGLHEGPSRDTQTASLVSISRTFGLTETYLNMP